MRLFTFKPSKKSLEIKWPERKPGELTPASQEKIVVMKALLDQLKEEEIDTTFIELVNLMALTYQIRFQADAFTLIKQIDLKHQNAK